MTQSKPPAVFVVLACLGRGCGHEVWVEAGGLRPWNGACPKCGVNKWLYLRQTENKVEGLSSAAADLGGRLVHVRK